MKYILSLFVLGVFCACSDTESRQDLTKTISLIKGEMVLDHGDLLISSSPFLNKVVGKDSLLIFDQPSKSLVLFDLKNKSPLIQIPFSSIGPDFIEDFVWDVEILEDKIYLLTESYISIFNFQGKIISRIDSKVVSGLNTDFKIHAFQMLNSSIGIFTQVPISSLTSGFKTQPETPIFFELDFLERQSSSMSIISPKEALLSDPSKGFYTGYSYHYMLLNDDNLIYNFRFSSTVYRYNLKTGVHDIFEAKSKYTQNIRKPILGKDLKGNSSKYFYDGPDFGKISFDSKTGYFVRANREFSRASDGSLVKKSYLMFFDENFQVVKDFALPEKLSTIPVVNDGKIYFRKLDSDSESTFEMVVYTIETN